MDMSPFAAGSPASTSAGSSSVTYVYIRYAALHGAAVAST